MAAVVLERGETARDAGEPAAQHVVPAHETGDVGALRRGVDHLGRGGLLDVALIHHHHHVGDRDRFELGVGDVDEGDAELALQAAQLAAHLQPEILVERRQRLVQQEHARVGDDRTRERDPLLLAARELRRHAVGERAELHLVEHGARPLPALGLGDPTHAQVVSDVVDDRHVREQGIALEHHRRAAAHRWQAHHVLAADPDHARARLLVTGDHAQDGGLAAAGRAQKATIAAVRNQQIDALDRDGRPELLGDASQLDLARAHGLAPLVSKLPQELPRVRSPVVPAPGSGCGAFG